MYVYIVCVFDIYIYICVCVCVCYTHENDHGPRELHFPMTILEVVGGLLVASALGDIFALDLHSEGQRGMVVP